MKDWFLIPFMAAQFVFGYYVMGRIGTFMEETRQPDADDEDSPSKDRNRSICMDENKDGTPKKRIR